MLAEKEGLGSKAKSTAFYHYKAVQNSLVLKIVLKIVDNPDTGSSPSFKSFVRRAFEIYIY
jgi:hypothetical protein